jgi:hypothetical protein
MLVENTRLQLEINTIPSIFCGQDFLDRQGHVFLYFSAQKRSFYRLSILIFGAEEVPHEHVRRVQP